MMDPPECTTKDKTDWNEWFKFIESEFGGAILVPVCFGEFGCRVECTDCFLAWECEEKREAFRRRASEEKCEDSADAYPRYYLSYSLNRSTADDKTK